MKEKCTGIIGGSGLYEMEGLTVKEERTVETPFGMPSDKLVLASLDGHNVAFLSRHGRGHKLNPSEVNNRANIWAMKSLGVDHILAVSAVGSMREELSPGHIVVVDQLIDRTRSRPYTFFENGIVAHISFADPFCQALSDVVYSAGKAVGAKIDKGGTYICIEGPMFSSRAESTLFRSWGVDVIGMTAYQEAKLAREAEICYSTMALVTDYDCWHESEEDVHMQAVFDTMKQNASTAQAIIRKAVPKVDVLPNECHCRHSLKFAIATDKSLITEEVKERLRPIIGKYFA